MKSLRLLFFIYLFSFLFCAAENASLIIYSYNRPLQLYSLLESIHVYVKGIDSINVIYRADSEYKKTYSKVLKDFPTVRFINQTNPKVDFKYLTVKTFEEVNSDYVIFAVDDIIVKDFINIDECIQALKKTGAYGFYFRLGKTIDFCYSLNCFQGIPDLTDLGENLFTWRFGSGKFDWNYPNNLDMTLYAKSKIQDMIHRLHYNSPNTLEGQWAGYANYDYFGLCYGDSKIVNLPMNIVQNDLINRHNHNYSAKELLDIFKKGFKLDIEQFFKIQNRSAHINFSGIKFVLREGMK